MKVIIHGGMYKTGTTSIQHMLAENSELLAQEGIVYPLTSSRQHSFWLDVRSSKWQPDFLTEIAENAEKEGAHTLLLSGETVCSHSDFQFLQLTQCFDRWPVEYVFGFRHWSSYLPSRWAQNCMRRDCQTFTQYLHQVLNPSLQHFDLRYDLIIQRAISSGASTVQCVSWDNAQLTHQTIAPILFQTMGINESLISKHFKETKWLNTQQPILFVEMCRVLNGLMDYDLGRKHNELFRAFAKHEECTIFYDHLNKLSSLDENIKHEIIDEITKHEWQPVKMPAFEDLEKMIFERFSHTFVNLQNSKIFNIDSKRSNEIETSQISWKNFLYLISSKSFKEFEQLHMCL